MRQEYLNSIKAGAIEGWYKYKITPSLTAAQAALESGWGTSKLAAPPYNNNFGIKAGAEWTGKTASMSTQEWNGSKFITIVDTFRAYDSINDSVEDHGVFFTSTEWRINNYRNVVGEGDYKKACYAVAKAGYATDPNYATKLINIIETYNLQSWDVEAQNGNPNNEAIENTKASKIVGGSISSAASQAVSSLLLSVIGDSLGVGTEKFLNKYSWAKVFHDNLGSRQWTHATASLDATKVLQTMINNGNLQQNVVFILGTNRGVTAAEIDNVVSMCGRDRNIILVDTASEVNHRNTVSNMYSEASKRHQNVYYANWSDYARANIATWYYADGANGTRIHMKDAGYQKHAEFIIQAVYEAANTNWVEEVSTPTEKNTERINIYDVEYDDGKYTSPKGDSSIYNKELNDQLGFRPKKAQIMWIERKYTGDEDNAADLLEAALKKMDEYSVPAAQYTVPMRYFPSEVSIGDTGYFIDHEFNPPLYIFARVLSMTTSVTNPGSDSVVIGNVIEVHPKDKADILALQKELQENREEARLEYWKVPPIMLQMISSNGLNFKTKPGELYSDLVHSTIKEPQVKNGFVDIPVHKAKKVGARISITGSIKNNYIDIVDEITSEMNAPIPQETFTGPVDPNSNPQGSVVKDITAPLDVRQLIVKQLDVQLLDSEGLNMQKTTLSVYEDSTFALKVNGLPKHINKIRILSNQNIILDDISALDTSDPVSGVTDKTRLYVKAFQEDKEVTHKFKNFSWTRISSNKRLDEEWNDANKFNETNGIDLMPADVFGNESTFVCKMFDGDGNFVAATSSSVTITQEGNKNTISGPTMPPILPSPGDKWTIIDGDLEEEYHYIDGEWVQTSVSKKVDTALEEAEQAKQAAEQAYQDAIDEAERLVTEQDAVWKGKMDDYDAQVAQIVADAQSAQDKANQALIDVGISTDLAQTAKDLATTAQSNASTAISNASQAISDASGAMSQALSAFNLATSAKSDVSTISLDVDEIAGQVSLKANQTVVDQLSGIVNNHTADISANAQAIQARLTSTQVSDLVDGKGLAKVTYVDNQISATAEGFSSELTKVEGKIDGLQFGVENLVLNSKKLIDVNNNNGTWGLIKANAFNTSRKLEVGKVYTITVKSGFGGYIPQLEVWLQGTQQIIKIPYKTGTHVSKNTFTCTYETDGLHIYGQYLAKDVSFIEWITIVEGNKGPADWVPATQDVLSQDEWTLWENDYTSTISGITTELSKTAKTTDLNGMVTESILATKQFVTAGSMNTTLSNYAQKNNVPTNTQFNTLKNSYDSMVQTIGTNGEKIAQVVMTDGLFQTTVRDSIDIGGRNLVKNSGVERKLITSVTNYIYYDLAKDIDYLNGEEVTLSFEAKSDVDGTVLEFYPRQNMKYPGFTILKTFPLSTGYRRYSYTWTYNFNRTNRAEHLFFRTIQTNDIHIQEVQLERGNVATDWSPAPEDKADQSQVIQLAGSWALTLKSGNDIKTQINASTNSIRLASKFIHLSGTSLIDDATIKSAHINSLNANKITGNAADFNTIRAGVLTTNAVTSTHISANDALIDKLFATSALIERLTTKTAFISQLKAIDLVADKASFVQAGWQGLNSNVTVDSSKIRLTNSAKDYIEMNGIPELRSQDNVGTAAILGKGRSHYYSGSQARFYIGSNLEGLAQYGVHIAKGQTWGIYRNSDSYGGTPAQYHTVLQGEHWRSITTKYWNDSTSVNVLMQLNGYNVNNYPVLQPGDVLLIKAAVPGNQSGVERVWTMGTASNGPTRVYSHVHHVFEGGTTGTSDERMKHNIEPTEVEALPHIEALTFKQFNWNRDNKFEPLGLIAQHSGILRVPDEDMEGIDIQRALMLALKGIQELQEEIKQLKGA